MSVARFGSLVMLWLMFCVCMMGFMIGFFGDEFLVHGYIANHPIELSEAERGTDLLRQKIPPTSFELRFEDEKKFHAEHPADGGGTTMGVSSIYTAPCVITLPTGEYIEANPKLGRAWFVGDFGDYLAHELLHCIRGHWHPAWKICFANQHEWDRDHVELRTCR